jgi:hypothetical protein
MRHHRLAYTAIVFTLAFTGCDRFGKSKETAPAQPPHVFLKRVPAKIKSPLGVLGATLEIDLSEIKELILDAKELYKQIVTGDPSSEPPEKGTPVIQVVNKKDNRYTYFALTPNIKEIKLRNKDAKEVTLIIKNQEPLRVELWLDSPNDVDVWIEFKDEVAAAGK